VASEKLNIKPLLLDDDDAERVKADVMDVRSVTLTPRQLCDLELLSNGAFSPLAGFMGKADYESVLEQMRLADGTLWPVPVTLEVGLEQAQALAVGDTIALRDDEGFMLAVLDISDIFEPDRTHEARQVYGTSDAAHAGVRQLLQHAGSVCLGGMVRALHLPTHYDFEALRHSPLELQDMFSRLGWRRVVAFHTTRPMHRMQRAICIEAAKRVSGHLLIHPVVGIARPGDVSYYARIKCYRAMERQFPLGIAQLSLLPLAMRMAGPREALWHALVRANYGCTHLIIANDHGSPPGQGFYEPYAAQALVQAHADELQIEMVPFERQTYVPARKRFVAESEARSGNDATAALSTAQFTERLTLEEPIPDWYSYPEVIDVLRTVHPPRAKLGLTLFFTGLSGAGKSTLAKIVYGRLIEDGSRPVTLLDGDVVRLNLSSELGFSKEHRNLNVRRIGFVASEITKNKGIAICAPIAPYAPTRRAVREVVAEHGAFVEIHVSTPLEVCESRDRKGLYAKARKGIIPEFTGVSDPYEVPEAPELRIDTSALSPMEAAEEVYLYLVREGYIETGD
jgi:sulfate adenylyltransferase